MPTLTPTEQTLSRALLAFVAAMIVLLSVTTATHGLDPDEFQHLQMAWLIAIGDVPYRDFFEHHAPLYHYLIAPLLSGSALMTNGDAAVHAVILLRVIGVVLSAGMVVLTYLIAGRLAERLAERRAALFASILLVSSLLFVQKSIEIRPDQLGALLLLISTLALMRARDSERHWGWYLLGSGMMATLAVLTTQKLVCAMPGLALTCGAALVMKRLPSRQVLYGIGIWICAAAATVLPLLEYFQSRGALSLFVTDSFLLAGKWEHLATFLGLVSLLCREDTLLVLLACAGVVAALKRGMRWSLAVAAPLFSMVLCMPLFPVVRAQYIFLILPYAAILGGIGAAAALSASAPEDRRSTQVATLLALVIALHGVMQVLHESAHSNAGTLQKLRYVIEQTDPDATVLTAWSPGVAFRKPAFPYFCLHEEIRAIIPREAYDKLLRGLRSGDIAPVLIDMDRDMEQLPPDIVAVLTRGWRPTGVGTLWRRNSASLTQVTASQVRGPR